MQDQLVKDFNEGHPWPKDANGVPTNRAIRHVVAIECQKRGNLQYVSSSISHVEFPM